MRDRLIELMLKSNEKFADVDCTPEEAIVILADYLIENGVIVLPCKIGDKLYFLYGSKVFNLTVEKIVIKEDGMFLVDKAFNDWYSIEELGKTLYLSEEEAEQALKRGGEG